MRLITTFTLLTICAAVSAQHFPTKKDGRKKTLTNPLTLYPGTFIDTEYLFTDSTGVAVIIQNSVAKGGAYTDSTGKDFGYRVFWSRIINESSTPLEITITFPADVIPIAHATSYLHVSLPPGTMSIDKEILYGYGITGLRSFFDKDLDKPTTLQRTINPKEEVLFYVAIRYYKSGGVTRAGFVLKGQELFYSLIGISSELESRLIPCGHITVKK